MSYLHVARNFHMCILCFPASRGQELSSVPANLPFCGRGSINLWMDDESAHTVGLWGAPVQLPETPLRWGFSHSQSLHLTSTMYRTQRWKPVSVYWVSLLFPLVTDPGPEMNTVPWRWLLPGTWFETETHDSLYGLQRLCFVYLGDGRRVIGAFVAQRRKGSSRRKKRNM